ncbi:MAG: hypothetical protein ABIF88_01030 [archaeon]
MKLNEIAEIIGKSSRNLNRSQKSEQSAGEPRPLKYHARELVRTSDSPEVFRTVHLAYWKTETDEETEEVIFKKRFEGSVFAIGYSPRMQNPGTLENQEFYFLQTWCDEPEKRSARVCSVKYSDIESIEPLKKVED